MNSDNKELSSSKLDLKFPIVHWNGKFLKNMSTRENIEWMAILIS